MPLVCNAICFAHCVHIYIDVMHIFIHVKHPWALYFVNTQKDVYKYCMPLCVNKLWCTVNTCTVSVTYRIIHICVMHKNNTRTKSKFLKSREMRLNSSLLVVSCSIPRLHMCGNAFPFPYQLRDIYSRVICNRKHGHIGSRRTNHMLSSAANGTNRMFH